MEAEATHQQRQRRPLPWAAGLCLLAAVAAFLLWDEHESHILRALPYLFLLACPLMHLLMHRDDGLRHDHH